MDWTYVVIALVVMSFFCLGCFASRIARWVSKRRLASKIASHKPNSLPKITGVELDKISKVLGQGRTIEEAKRYARVNCPNHRCLSDEDYKELAGQ